MKRTALHRLRAALLTAPTEPAWAVFEAAMLVRAAEPARDRRGPRVTVGPLEEGLLAEFDSAAAAQRLVATAGALARGARIESGHRGGRHRYEIHRVMAPPESMPAIRATLAESAATGLGVLRGRPGRGPVVAAAMWRAALLACGPGRGGNDQITVKVGDPDCARALVVAASLLHVPIQAVCRPGGQLISVADPAAFETLVEAITGAPATTRARTLVTLAG